MSLLQEGDVIELKAGHRVYATAPRTLVSENAGGDWGLERHNIKIDREIFSYLEGRYVVVKTTLDGGSSGHAYPNGHHVWCEHAEGGFKVDFYQTGCFTAMITDIEPVGRAVRTWAVEDEKEAAP